MAGIPGVNQPAAVPGVSSRAALVSYYAGILGQLPGTYQGSQKAYDGLTWPQLYEKLAAAQPSADPKQLADTVLGIAGTQGAATGVNASAAGAINTGTSIAKGANAAANQNFGLPQIPRPFGSVLDFLNALGNSNTWIRVVKVIAGGALLLIGLAHITGATGTAADYARRVPLPV